MCRWQRVGAAVLFSLPGGTALAQEGTALPAESGATWEPLDMPAPIAGTGAIYLPDMTWMEVRDAMAAGKGTILVPTGGIEQNGPFLVLGKHDRLAREAAERTARRLGDALVAPVVSYVPEGGTQPALAHMRYPGTVGVSEATFEAVLEDVCRALRAHGFEHIVLVGDSGGNQRGQREVAERLDRAWASSGTRVHHIAAFYDPEGANELVVAAGIAWTADVYHDDPGFTLQLLAVDPKGARVPQREAAGLLTTDGFSLSPFEVRAAVGEAILDARATSTAEAIVAARASPPASRLGHLLGEVVAPVSWVADPRQRIYVVYLVSALLLGGGAVLWRQGRSWSIPSLFGELFPRRVWLSRDAGQDVVYTLINGALMAWILDAWTWLADDVRGGMWGALELLGVGPFTVPGGWPVCLAVTIASVLAVDFGIFLSHWLQHRVPILWAFHKTHHAARQLTPLTVFRQHPVDFAGTAACAAVTAGAAAAVIAWLTGGAVPAVGIAGLNAVTFLFYVCGYTLRHTHIWFDFGWLDRVFVSPAMHQVHHSDAPRHWDRNMGLVFSFWDQIFGTAYLPKAREELTFGIGDESGRFRTAWDFWMEPVRELLGSPRPVRGRPAEGPKVVA